MKIYVNRLPVINRAWGGGAHFVNACYCHITSHGHEVCKNTDVRPDAILIVGLDDDGNGLSASSAVMFKTLYAPSTKLILRVNENDERKGTKNVNKELLDLSRYVDGTVFVSHWLKEEFLKLGWACKNNTVIYNGVDREIYKPGEKLGNGRINIVAHHWSSHPLKGSDIYEKLDEFVGVNSDQFTFTYIGRTESRFKHTIVKAPMWGKAMGQELSRYDVYVSGSRNDPGPNHIVEGISCEIPTYVHKDGGGCVEFAGQDHAYDDFDALKQILLSGNFKQNLNKFNDWKTCVNEYVKFIECT